MNNDHKTLASIAVRSFKGLSLRPWITRNLRSLVMILGGCASTVNPNAIEVVKPTRNFGRSVKKFRSYEELSWQEAIKAVETPKQVKKYLKEHFSYDFDEGTNFLMLYISRGESFRENHTHRKGVCVDYASAAAALLSDNGFPPLLLKMADGKNKGHSIFLYKTERGFGALGSTSKEDRFETIDELVRAMEKSTECKYVSYSVINLDTVYPNREWIHSDRVNFQLIHPRKWYILKK